MMEGLVVNHSDEWYPWLQVYGKMKKDQDSKAEDIEYLLHRFPNLRVAYIDETRGYSTVSYSSVLIKSSPNPDRVKTIEEVRA